MDDSQGNTDVDDSQEIAHKEFLSLRQTDNQTFYKTQEEGDMFVTRHCMHLDTFYFYLFLRHKTTFKEAILLLWIIFRSA